MKRMLVSELGSLLALDPPVHTVDLLFDPATGKGLFVSIEQKNLPVVSYPLAAVRFVDQKLIVPDPASLESVSGQSLLRLAVRTVSGESLGRVHDVAFYWETGALRQIVVGGRLPAWLSGPELLVVWDDIEAIRPDEILVRDRIVPKHVGVSAVVEALNPVSPAA